ncbi:hypothetical protein [Streptomyces sp. NPDC048581]|uniref:hypothetical protein n=1 Tax=unclassified Streptomyces TaxID=2593676 RepID=UPI00371DF95F
MGIRTLNRRTTPASANVNTEGDAPLAAQPSTPPFAPGASTARIPRDLVTTLRLTATTVRRRAARRAPGWAELARSYLALARTWLPRPRPVRTVTVFVATAGALTEPQDGSPPDRPHPRPHPNPHHQGPGPAATP